MGKHKGQPHTLAFPVSGDHMDAWQARIEAMLSEVSAKIDCLLRALAEEDDDPSQADLDGFTGGAERDANQPL